MERVLESLGWLLVEGMLASLVMVLVVVRIARTHDRKGAQDVKSRSKEDGEKAKGKGRVGAGGGV